ncbi:MAG: hypothetical protein ACI3XQ_01125 [Eubacteriales bacterium]
MNGFQYVPLKESGKVVLLDTDIGPDCDDAGAIAVLAVLAKKYGVTLKAVISCTSNPYGAPCAEALCDYFDLKVGAFAENKEKCFLDRENNMRYNKYVAEHFGKGKKYPDAVSTYRRMLAGVPDKGAVVVAIGPFATLAQLIMSSGDKYSPLSGEELFERKVYAVIAMAGKYPEGREYNIICDPKSAIVFFDRCRVPLFFSDFDVGYSVKCGFPERKEPQLDDPLYMSYLLYCTGGDYTKAQMNSGYDLTAVQFAFEGTSDTFGVSDPERFWVRDDGYNVFTPDPNGNCRRLLKRCSDRELGHYYDGILSSFKRKNKEADA